MSEANDYEKERQRNIRENEALMRELGVLHGSTALGAPRRSAAAAAASSSSASSTPRSTRRAKPASTSTPKKAKPTRVLPTRSSARLAGHEADSETLKRKYEAEAEQARIETERAKRARHAQFDLSGMTGGELEAEQIKRLERTLAGLVSNMAHAAELVDLGEEQKARDRVARATPTKDRADLEEVLNRMTLRSAAKVTRSRVYSMVFHPTTDKDLVFVGDKEGAIGIWDAAAAPAPAPKPSPPIRSEAEGDGDEQEAQDDGRETEEPFPEGSAWSLQVHGKSPVTCLKLDPVSSNALFSCSYDATVRKLDLVTQTSTEVWAGEEDVLLSVFDVLAPSTHAAAFTETPHPSLDERSMWIADHRGGLLHIDLREGKRGGATSRRWQVCEKKIGALALNRVAPHCVATASLDQHVRLFDVRALATIRETAEAPYNYKGVDPDDLDAAQRKSQFAVHKARQACTSVDFSPRGDQLVGVSYDDVVKVWSLQPSWLHSKAGAQKRNAVAAAAVKSERATSPSSTAAAAAAASSPNGNGNGRPRRSNATVAVKTEAKASNSLLSWITRKPAAAIKTEEDLAELVKDEQVHSEPEEAEGKPSDLLADPVRIPHNNQTGKWLTMFRARWNQNPDVEPHFTIGSMTRRAEIYASDGTLLRALWDEEIVTAVPAVTAMHPRITGKLATGNASGRCTFWDASDAV